MVWAVSWRKKISIHPGFASRALTRTPFVNFRLLVVFGRFWFPSSGCLFPEWYFYKQFVASGHSAGTRPAFPVIPAKWGRRVRRGPSLPHAPGARMTVVHTNSLKQRRCIKFNQPEAPCRRPQKICFICLLAFYLWQFWTIWGGRKTI